MRKFLLFSFLLAIIINFNSCIADDLADTQIKVRVVDADAQINTDVSVKLFEEYTDCVNNQSDVSSKNTDSNGTVIFSNLESDKLYNVRVDDDVYISSCNEARTIEEEIIEIKIVVTN